MPELAVVSGECVNEGVPGQLGHDAVARDDRVGIWALADGANSCPDAGNAARWLVAQAVDRLRGIDDLQGLRAAVFELHHQMRAQHPETAATLLLARRVGQSMLLASVGDSIIRCFTRGAWPWSPWREPTRLPVDTNAQGHPWQLVGSEVCEQVHCASVPIPGSVAVLLMSDGVGAHVPSSEVARLLATLGRSRPSAADLRYLCESLVQAAVAAGSQDDASAALAWLGP